MSLVLLLGPQLRAFADAGMEVIGVSAPGPYVAELESWGIRHEPLRHATRAAAIGQDALALVELWRLLRALRPDIVHTHNPKPGFYGRLAARAAGVPGIVNTVHGLYATPEDPLARRVAVYSLERLASTCSGLELVQNPEDLELLARLGVPRRKLVLLGNGVDIGRFRPEPDEGERRLAREELGLAPDAVVVGMVARLVWQKGFRELFAAAAVLARTHPEIVFVVVGGTDDDKADAIGVGDMEEAGRRGHLVFAGTRHDMERVYPAFDLFVLPSYREGFPRAAMEAAACGVPVIATDIRGCREVVDHGETGLLVAPRDATALADAIADVATDPVRRQAMAEASRRKAEVDFDDRAVVRTSMEAYARVLGLSSS